MTPEQSAKMRQAYIDRLVEAILDIESAPTQFVGTMDRASLLLWSATQEEIDEAHARVDRFHQALICESPKTMAVGSVEPEPPPEPPAPYRRRRA